MNNLHGITTAISWLGFFATIFFAYYYYLKFRNKERMLLIEKNADIAEVYKKKDTQFPWFITGFSLMGLALGFTIGFITLLITKMGEIEGLFLATSLSVLCGAIGIIIGNIIENKRK